jgi:hypothetical protein
MSDDVTKRRKKENIECALRLRLHIEADDHITLFILHDSMDGTRAKTPYGALSLSLSLSFLLVWGIWEEGMEANIGVGASICDGLGLEVILLV